MNTQLYIYIYLIFPCLFLSEIDYDFTFFCFLHFLLFYANSVKYCWLKTWIWKNNSIFYAFKHFNIIEVSWLLNLWKKTDIVLEVVLWYNCQFFFIWFLRCSTSQTDVVHSYFIPKSFFSRFLNVITYGYEDFYFIFKKIFQICLSFYHFPFKKLHYFQYYLCTVYFCFDYTC